MPSSTFWIPARLHPTHYGLYDLDRVERIVLRNIATAYFVLPVDHSAPENDDDR